MQVTYIPEDLGFDDDEPPELTIVGDTIEALIQIRALTGEHVNKQIGLLEWMKTERYPFDYYLQKEIAESFYNNVINQTQHLMDLVEQGFEFSYSFYEAVFSLVGDESTKEVTCSFTIRDTDTDTMLVSYSVSRLN